MEDSARIAGPCRVSKVSLWLAADVDGKILLLFWAGELVHDQMRPKMWRPEKKEKKRTLGNHWPEESVQRWQCMLRQWSNLVSKWPLFAVANDGLPPLSHHNGKVRHTLPYLLPSQTQMRNLSVHSCRVNSKGACAVEIGQRANNKRHKSMLGQAERIMRSGRRKSGRRRVTRSVQNSCRVWCYRRGCAPLHCTQTHFSSFIIPFLSRSSQMKEELDLSLVWCWLAAAQQQHLLSGVCTRTHTQWTKFLPIDFRSFFPWLDCQYLRSLPVCVCVWIDLIYSWVAVDSLAMSTGL